MIVKLKDLEPNPRRNFAVDPVNPDAVEQLRKSIDQYGFWGGVVVRQMRDSTKQIAAGHHRVEAALKAGIEEADLTVVDEDDCDDNWMVRVYATENATQRGQSSTAMNGTVIAAIYQIAKMALTDSFTHEFVSEFDVPTIRGHLTSQDGIGEPTVSFYLKGVPGITRHSVLDALASLKKSDDYSLTIHQVQEDIQREEQEAFAALDEAEEEKRKADAAAAEAKAEAKAASARARAAKDEAAKKKAELEEKKAEALERLTQKRKEEAETELAKLDPLRQTRDTAEAAAVAANTKKPTFDLKGVQNLFKNTYQLNVFRDCVTGQGIAPYLPVKKQASLAREIIKMAATQKAELSGSFIKSCVTQAVLTVKREAEELSRKEKEEIERKDYQKRIDHKVDDFSKKCNQLALLGMEISSLIKDRPDGVEVRIDQDFRTRVKSAQKSIEKLVALIDRQ